MQLISEEYRKLNVDKHKQSKLYGTSGKNYLNDIIPILRSFQTQDVLDYGCGKSTLAHNLPFTIKQYDPAIPKYAELPKAADILICTDVLEHIEPEYIDDVLKHMASLMKVAGFLEASTVKANKTLADGRNAHILLHDAEWWVTKIAQYFDIATHEVHELGVKFVVTAKKGQSHA